MIISVITVCFNSARTIEQTIQSVLSQNYPNVEYIVIDGGSTDDTLAILNRYQASIKTMISEPDRGIYDAMNKGIQHAHGDIIGFLNADDLYAHSEVLSRLSQVFQSPTIEACYGDLMYFSDGRPERAVRYWRGGHFKKGLFSKGWNPPHPTFFVRRSVYQQYGGFDISYSMGNDIELMMRFLEKHQIRSFYLPELMVKMRLGGVSNRALKNIIIQNQAIIKAAKSLGIPCSRWQFIVGKILNRLAQFVFKSRRTYRHVN